MAIIIETCPKCGHDLHDLIIATNPPIAKKECWCCGWTWEGEPERIVRVPFGRNATNTTNAMEIPSLNDYLNSQNDFYPKGYLVGNFEQSACINCSNNPKNGGDGICFCTAGQMHVAY